MRRELTTQVMALFAHEMQFWIDFTRIYWLDEGYVHPLFSPYGCFLSYSSYTYFDSEL